MCLACLFLILGWVGYYDEDCYYYFADYHAQGRRCGSEGLAEPMAYGKLLIVILIGLAGVFFIFYKPRK